MFCLEGTILSWSRFLLIDGMHSVELRRASPAYEHTIRRVGFSPSRDLENDSHTLTSRGDAINSFSEDEDGRI